MIDRQVPPPMICCRRNEMNSLIGAWWCYMATLIWANIGLSYIVFPGGIKPLLQPRAILLEMLRVSIIVIIC